MHRCGGCSYRGVLYNNRHPTSTLVAMSVRIKELPGFSLKVVLQFRRNCLKLLLDTELQYSLLLGHTLRWRVRVTPLPIFMWRNDFSNLYVYKIIAGVE